MSGYVGGEAGVSHALELIKQEVKRDMGLLAVTSLPGITRNHICSSR
ncbi:alpha-hydroxy-acid oxidizing protein [Collimonas fungivorans]|nr:alpha-hydroxy-acid oxidizing protein [Collimonas fungivorans]